jgi:hypothetical protein
VPSRPPWALVPPGDAVVVVHAAACVNACVGQLGRCVAWTCWEPSMCPCMPACVFAFTSGLFGCLPGSGPLWCPRAHQHPPSLRVGVHHHSLQPHRGCSGQQVLFPGIHGGCGGNGPPVHGPPLVPAGPKQSVARGCGHGSCRGLHFLHYVGHGAAGVVSVLHAECSCVCWVLLYLLSALVSAECAGVGCGFVDCCT